MGAPCGAYYIKTLRKGMATDTVIAFFFDMLFMSFIIPGLAFMTAAANALFHAGGLRSMATAAGYVLAMLIVHGFKLQALLVMTEST